MKMKMPTLKQEKLHNFNIIGATIQIIPFNVYTNVRQRLYSFCHIQLPGYRHFYRYCSFYRHGDVDELRAIGPMEIIGEECSTATSSPPYTRNSISTIYQFQERSPVNQGHLWH